MQTITISYDGNDLSIPIGTEINDNQVSWTIQLFGVPQPPTPNLIVISIFYLNAGVSKYIICEPVMNSLQVQTDLSNIPDQLIKVSILLYHHSTAKIVNNDVDIIIRRDNIQT